MDNLSSCWCYKRSIGTAAKPKLEPGTDPLELGQLEYLRFVASKAAALASLGWYHAGSLKGAPCVLS
jgi:hypothetical protein